MLVTDYQLLVTNKMHELLTSIHLALKNLRSNIGRTVLSLLGIVIGVMAVVVVLSLGAGVKDFVVSQVESFGTDVVQIEVKVPNTKQVSAQNAGSMAGGMAITTFKIEDAEEVSKLSNVGSWYGGTLGQGVASYADKNKQAFLFGVTSGIEGADANFKLEEGEMFLPEDDKNLKQVVVLGSKVKQTFFGSSNAIGNSIRIGGQAYKVIGVLASRGGGAGFFDFDEIIYLPVRTLQKKIMGVDYITFAIYEVTDLTKMELTILEMEEVMRSRHGIEDPDDDDFAVMSIAEAKDLLDQVFSVVNILLIALTSISLIVGGVGITNVMYVTVVERTFEIGLRKAVGAKNSDIMKQFLFEAVFLTMIGGAFGILLGFLLSKVAEYVIAKFGFALSFPLAWNAVVIAIAFSAITGLVFGLRPAQTASKLSPMEALRKE